MDVEQIGTELLEELNKLKPEINKTQDFDLDNLIYTLNESGVLEEYISMRQAIIGFCLIQYVLTEKVSDKFRL